MVAKQTTTTKFRKHVNACSALSYNLYNVKYKVIESKNHKSAYFSLKIIFCIGFRTKSMFQNVYIVHKTWKKR